MPQKRSGFQSKPRFGGGKAGGGKKFGGRGRGRPDGGGFGKRSEGDRSERPERSERSERPERREWKGDGERVSRPRGDRPFGDRPPFKKKAFGDKKFEGRGDRGDRPFKKFEDRGDRGGDRGGERGERPFKKRPFGDKKFEDRGDRGGERKSGFGGDRPFKKRFDDKGDRGGDRGGDRPFKKSFEDRGDRGGDRPFKKKFEDRGDRGGDRPFKKKFEDRPERSFDDRKKFGDKKPYTRYEERPRSSENRSFEKEPVSFETRQKLKSDRAQYGAPSSAFLYGAHAVREALLNPKRLHQRLLCTQRGYELISEAWVKAANAGLKVPQPQYVEKEDIERLLPRDAVHQDILLDCQPLEEVFLADIVNAASENAKILVLDQVTDPHNVGAILRSAAAFGASAVVAQRLHSPDITGIIAKAASGAVEHVPFVREVNLSRALEQLKEAGFFCIGLAEEGKQTLGQLKLSGKVALVLGAEGEGLRRLVAENCDELVKLPTQGPIGSLNVSNAAAVALYEVTR